MNTIDDVVRYQHALQINPYVIVIKIPVKLDTIRCIGKVYGVCFVTHNNEVSCNTTMMGP